MFDQSREFTFALRPLAASLLIVSAAMLTACGGSSSSDNPHEHTDIDTAGRLALFDTDASQLKVLDLDNSEVLASMAMDGEAPRLYASPVTGMQLPFSVVKIWSLLWTVGSIPKITAITCMTMPRRRACCP